MKIMRNSPLRLTLSTDSDDNSAQQNIATTAQAAPPTTPHPDKQTEHDDTSADTDAEWEGEDGYKGDDDNISWLFEDDEDEDADNMDDDISWLFEDDDPETDTLDQLHQQTGLKRDDLKTCLSVAHTLQQQVQQAYNDSPNRPLERLQRLIIHEVESLQDELAHHEAQHQSLQRLSESD